VSVPTDKQRREAARRHLERQLQRREEREAARKRFTLIASIVGTVVLIAVVVGVVVAVGHDDKKKPAAASRVPTGTPSDSSPPATAAAKYPCSWTKGGTAARAVKVPDTKPPKSGKVVIDVGTNRGKMVFTLDRAAAPCTVGSFVSLVKQKFYDNTPCPRVESKNLFILQCGDPTGTTSGGPGYTIPDEYKGTEKYSAGVLAMANTGTPDSGGSQFFIVYKQDPLPAKYTIFGKVTAGLAVVTKVAAAGNDGSNQAGGGKPKLPIKFTKLTIKSGG
jgi:peptidyl-prolyl cis-trans isomerase B (cyclophilin B)